MATKHAYARKKKEAVQSCSTAFCQARPSERGLGAIAVGRPGRRSAGGRPAHSPVRHPCRGRGGQVPRPAGLDAEHRVPSLSRSLCGLFAPQHVGHRARRAWLILASGTYFLRVQSGVLASILLASKVENTPRKAKDIIAASTKALPEVFPDSYLMEMAHISVRNRPTRRSLLSLLSFFDTSRRRNCAIASSSSNYTFAKPFRSISTLTRPSTTSSPLGDPCPVRTSLTRQAYLMFFRFLFQSRKRSVDWRGISF